MKLTDGQIQNIVDHLPHGSGIDLDWVWERKGKKVHCYNSFHYRDENGFYDGWQDFVLILFCGKENKLDFVVESVGGWSRRLAAAGLRDYLEDLFANSLPSD